MINLNFEQRDCIRIINKLIYEAEDLNEALIQNINSVEAIYRRHSLLALMNELI